MTKSKSSVKLTRKTLQELKDNGFLYVLVKGYTLDRCVDHIQLNHFTLLPVRELPSEPGKKGIYAPLDSEVLSEWASFDDNGPDAFIQFDEEPQY